jgi:hypothetical protein
MLLIPFLTRFNIRFSYLVPFLIHNKFLDVAVLELVCGVCVSIGGSGTIALHRFLPCPRYISFLHCLVLW